MMPVEAHTMPHAELASHKNRNGSNLYPPPSIGTIVLFVTFKGQQVLSRIHI